MFRMKNKRTLIALNLALLTACAALVLACRSHRHGDYVEVREPVTIQTLLWMNGEHWPPDRMIHEIRSRGVNPALTPDDIITLTNAGTPQAVIDAAVNAPTTVAVHQGRAYGRACPQCGYNHY